jgi:hypothetical protein
MAAPVRHAMSLEEIAAVESTSVAAIHMLLSRALRKLRSKDLIFTGRELALELDRNQGEH